MTDSSVIQDVADSKQNGEFTAEIGLPAVIQFRIDGTKVAFEVCPYFALSRMSEQEAESEPVRWERVESWLCEVAKLKKGTIKRNQLYDFWDMVNAVVEVLEEDRKKKVESMRSSLLSFLASRQVTNSGLPFTSSIG